MFPFTLQQLLILKALATEKNFNKASDLLYLSQPFFTKQIQILEQNLNVLLIRKQNNKIYFTENGKVLLHYAERILALSEEYCRVLMDFKNGERGNLTISASQTVGKYLLPKVIELFAKNYPQIDLKINLNSTRTIVKNVKNRDVDLAFVSGKVPKEFKKHMLVESLLEDEISLIVPKSYCLALKSIISKEDLYHLNFITLSSRSTLRKFTDTILTQNEIEINQLKIILQLNSMEGIKAAVSLGLGAAFVSLSTIEKEIEFTTIQIIKIENINITRSLSLVNNLKFSRSKPFKFLLMELFNFKNNLEN